MTTTQTIPHFADPAHWDACEFCGTWKINLYQVTTDSEHVHVTCSDRDCRSHYTIDAKIVDESRVCYDCGRVVRHSSSLSGACCDDCCDFYEAKP